MSQGAAIQWADGGEEFTRLLNLGNDHLASGEVEEARAAIEEAVALRPQDAKARGLLALCLFKLGELDEAAAAYGALSRENPFDITLHVNLGLVFLKAGKTADAIQSLELATGLAPEHRRAQNYLGLAYAQQGELEKARTAFVQAGSASKVREMDQAIAAKRGEGEGASAERGAKEGSEETRLSRAITQPFLQRPPELDQPLPKPIQVGSSALESSPPGPAEAQQQGASSLESSPPGPAEAQQQGASSLESSPPGPAEAQQQGASSLASSPPGPAEAQQQGASALAPSPPGPAQAQQQGSSSLESSPSDPAQEQSQGSSAPKPSPAGPAQEQRQIAPTPPLSSAPRQEELEEPVGGELPSLAELTRASRLFWPRGAPFAIGEGVVSIDFSAGIFTRVDGLIAARGDTSWSQTQKRFAGKLIARPFGEGARQMWHASGGGQLLISSSFQEEERIFSALRLEDDAYVVEDRLFAFEESVDAENGRVPGQGIDLPLVRLRGDGHLLLVTSCQLRSEPIFGNESLRVPMMGLVGWSGHLTPRLYAMSEGPEGTWVELSGEGDVLLLA